MKGEVRIMKIETLLLGQKEIELLISMKDVVLLAQCHVAGVRGGGAEVTQGLRAGPGLGDGAIDIAGDTGLLAVLTETGLLQVLWTATRNLGLWFRPLSWFVSVPIRFHSGIQIDNFFFTNLCKIEI